MVRPELERKNAVTQVVPVDDDLAPSKPPHEPDQRESRYTWRILTLKCVISDAELKKTAQQGDEPAL
jgi:hypothetical protein